LRYCFATAPSRNETPLLTNSLGVGMKKMMESCLDRQFISTNLLYRVWCVDTWH
jgi:hypothetical protein